MRHEWKSPFGKISPCYVDRSSGSGFTVIHCTAEQGAVEILQLAERVRELAAADAPLLIGPLSEEDAAKVARWTAARIAALEEENRDFAIRDAGWKAFGASLEADLGLDPAVYHLSAAEEIRTAIRGLEARARAAEEENRRLREALALRERAENPPAQPFDRRAHHP
jgi:hypothetical protein